MQVAQSSDSDAKTPQPCVPMAIDGKNATLPARSDPQAADSVAATESSSDEEMPLYEEVTVAEPTAHSVVETLSERATQKAAETVARRNRRRQLLACCTRPTDK